jgi:hypothetical protein
MGEGPGGQGSDLKALQAKLGLSGIPGISGREHGVGIHDTPP